MVTCSTHESTRRYEVGDEIGNIYGGGGITLQFLDLSPASAFKVKVIKNGNDGHKIIKIKYETNKLISHEFTELKRKPSRKRVQYHCCLSNGEIGVLFPPQNHVCLSLVDILKEFKPEGKSKPTGTLSFVILNENTQEQTLLIINIKSLQVRSNSHGSIVSQVNTGLEVMNFTYSTSGSKVGKQSNSKIQKARKKSEGIQPSFSFQAWESISNNDQPPSHQKRGRGGRVPSRQLDSQVTTPAVFEVGEAYKTAQSLEFPIGKHTNHYDQIARDTSVQQDGSDTISMNNVENETIDCRFQNGNEGTENSGGGDNQLFASWSNMPPIAVIFVPQMYGTQQGGHPQMYGTQPGMLTGIMQPGVVYPQTGMTQPMGQYPPFPVITIPLYPQQQQTGMAPTGYLTQQGIMLQPQMGQYPPQQQVMQHSQNISIKTVYLPLILLVTHQFNKMEVIPFP